MQKDHSHLEDYLLNLEDKGFKFKEDAIAFIYLGKQSTGSDDYLVSVSIELTLMALKRFDGSFYLSLLERLMEKNIETKEQAYELVTELGMLQST